MTQRLPFNIIYLEKFFIINSHKKILRKLASKVQGEYNAIITQNYAQKFHFSTACIEFCESYSRSNALLVLFELYSCLKEVSIYYMHYKKIIYIHIHTV